MSPKYYKGIRINSLGLPIFVSNKSKRVKLNDRKKSFYNTIFYSPFKKDSPKNLIIIYDIPEAKKKERDWLRRHLKKFNYVMIQRSVWVGPSPLPKDFLDYLKEIKIGNDFKTFKLTKSYDPKKKTI